VVTPGNALALASRSYCAHIHEPPLAMVTLTLANALPEESDALIALIQVYGVLTGNRPALFSK
jgi:hypothetical protein